MHFDVFCSLLIKSLEILGSISHMTQDLYFCAYPLRKYKLILRERQEKVRKGHKNGTEKGHVGTKGESFGRILRKGARRDDFASLIIGK